MVQVHPVNLRGRESRSFDQFLGAIVPAIPVVAKHHLYHRDIPVPNQRPHLFYTRFQPVIHIEHFGWVKQCANGLNGCLHAIFWKMSHATQIFVFVFALKQSDLKFAIFHIAHVKHIHAGIAATLGEVLCGLFQWNAQSGGCTEQHECGRLFLLWIVTCWQQVAIGADNAVQSLIDDACVNVHGRS